MLTHGNLVSNLRQMLAVPGMMLGKDDVGLAAVPLFHVFGLNVVLGLTLATGAALVCEERFEPEAALRLVEDRGVTVVAGAPPMFADWAEMSEWIAEGFAGVRLLLLGGGRTSADVGREVHRQVRPADLGGIRTYRGFTGRGDVGGHRRLPATVRSADHCPGSVRLV